MKITITEERPFCETKGKIVVFNILTIIRALKSLPHFSLDNLSNIKTVVKDCVLGKSNSWLVYADFHQKPIAKTIPLVKRKPSERIAKLMTEYYEASASDDLALAKEFEEIDAEIDLDSSQ
jgi:hypothetical protein